MWGQKKKKVDEFNNQERKPDAFDGINATISAKDFLSGRSSLNENDDSSALKTDTFFKKREQATSQYLKVWFTASFYLH